MSSTPSKEAADRAKITSAEHREDARPVAADSVHDAGHFVGDAGPQRAGGHQADADERDAPVEGVRTPGVLVGDAGPQRPGPDKGHRADADERV